ncbi:MAG: hypothetical protein IKF14_01560 [Atopobiaceae bacterium]|nr:hypothetical protein [Atopobiaceae bacterium]
MGVDKSFMVTLASALLAAVQTTGCTPASEPSQVQPVTESVDNANEESPVPTSRDLEIAAQLGLSQKRIDEMQQDGMKLRERSHIRMAERLVDLLEAKYGFDFEARDIDGPELLDQMWRLQARVSSGDLEGTDVTCEMPASGDDSDSTDDLVSCVRSDEIREHVENLIMDVCGDQVAHWAGSCVVDQTMLGPSFTLNTSTETLAQHVDTGVWMYFGPDFPLGEDGYKDIAQKLQERLSKENVACVVTMRHLTHLPKGEEEKGFSLGAAQRVVREGKPDVDYEWEMIFGPQSQEEA